VNKKPLIGVSICGVVLLVLGSLSNVVGYQSVNSTAANDSPLFNMRIQNAIYNDSKRLLTSSYMGKGKNSLLIPMPDNRTLWYRAVIDKIRLMDRPTFNNFITMAIRLIHKEPQFKSINSQKVIPLLYQLRNNQNIFLSKNINVTDNANIIPITYHYLTYCPLQCLIVFIEEIIVDIFFIGFIILLTIFLGEDCLNPPTSMTMCCH
jgi:hypothetical protein